MSHDDCAVRHERIYREVMSQGSENRASTYQGICVDDASERHLLELVLLTEWGLPLAAAALWVVALRVLLANEQESVGLERAVVSDGSGKYAGQQSRLTVVPMELRKRPARGSLGSYWVMS